MGLVEPTSGAVTVLGADDAAAAPPRAAPDELREPLREHADAAHGAAEPQRVRHALWLRRRRRPHRARWRTSSTCTISSTAQTGKLSSGQKTRVALAKSLINQPEILLLDEPTASLDPDTADWVRGRLERYRRERGATVLLASHNMNEVERLCDRVIMLKTGRIEDDDTPAALIARYGRSNLEEVFLDIARGTGEAREAAR